MIIEHDSKFRARRPKASIQNDTLQFMIIKQLISNQPMSPHSVYRCPQLYNPEGSNYCYDLGAVELDGEHTGVKRLNRICNPDFVTTLYAGADTVFMYSVGYFIDDEYPYLV